MIDRSQCEAAVQAIHDGFGLDQASAQVPNVGVQSSAGSPSPRVSKINAQEVVKQLAGMEDIVVNDVYDDTTQARVTLTNLSDKPGTASDVFSAVADGGVLVDMIIQNAGRNDAANLTFTVPRADVEKTVELLKAPLADHPDAVVSCDSSIGKLSVAGIGLRSHTDVGACMFRALADNEINVQMVNTSEIKVSVVVAESQCSKALDVLREVFDLA